MSPTDELVSYPQEAAPVRHAAHLGAAHPPGGGDQLAYPEFLYRLLGDEVERREAQQLALRTWRSSSIATTINPQLPIIHGFGPRPLRGENPDPF